jgi:outer membrane receptor protein involved in Fe transport
MLWFAAALLTTAGTAHAQSTTGTISGRVVDAQALPMPGVTISAESPNLQGIRTVVTSSYGDYLLTLLPPGTYKITFELSGFERQERTVNLSPTQVLPLEMTLGPAALSETVTVIGRSADVLMRTAQVAINFSHDLLSTLPTTRDINAALLLAPSVHASGPFGGYSIAGAMSYENLFLINGATVSENLRGQPYDLYIEDAIQETTIATAGISAEYGRFGGGVVNVITKSGGNLFSGSFRDTLINDNWRALTPFAADRKVDDVLPAYEYTLGGPVLHDRLWFFTAGRFMGTKEGRTTAITNLPYTFSSDLRRYEGKGTYSLTSSHRFEGAYIASTDHQTNASQNPANVMDTNSLYNAKRNLNLITVNYAGILTPSFALEARFSVRNETLKDVGATTTDLIAGTLLTDVARGGTRYWSPTFCGICAPEERDNRNVFVKGSYFLSKSGTGSHSLVFGYDGFNDRIWKDNHQSGSDYRILGTTSIINGASVTPVFLGGSTIIQWNPIFLSSQGTQFRTHSVFLSDQWRVSSRLSANLGLRFDRNAGANSAGDTVANDSAWSPRLGIVWDPTGEGKWSVTTSFARYVAALNNGVANSSSAAGNPDTYQFIYRGPSINAGGVAATPTEEAVQQAFDWFFANGGPNLPLNGSPNIPGVTPQILGSLTSPNVLEYAGGINRQFGNRAALRVDMTYRDYHDLYASRADQTTGQVTDKLGRPFDLALIENTDALTRRYGGVSTQATYRVSSALDLGGTYTLSRTWGNFDGETLAGGAGLSANLFYPEYRQEAWNYPEGDLATDQRHRARLWATYGLPWVSGLTVSALQTLESGVPYGAVTSSGVDPQPFVINPGYLTPPTGSTTFYYFTARDAFRTEGQRRTDMALNYSYRPHGLGRIQLFGQLQVINIFNQFQLCGCGAPVSQNGGAIRTERIDQAVRTAVTTPAGYQTFNPFTTTPVEGVNWAKGPNFGNALNRLSYTSPRALRLSFGVRF